MLLRHRQKVLKTTKGIYVRVVLCFTLPEYSFLANCFSQEIYVAIFKAANMKNYD